MTVHLRLTPSDTASPYQLKIQCIAETFVRLVQQNVNTYEKAVQSKHTLT